MSSVSSITMANGCANQPWLDAMFGMETKSTCLGSSQAAALDQQYLLMSATQVRFLLYHAALLSPAPHALCMAFCTMHPLLGTAVQVHCCLHCTLSCRV